MSFGDWEGHAIKRFEKWITKTYRQWVESPHLVKLPGGESLDDVRGRAMAALEEVLRKHSEKTIVLVSHRVVCKVMICAILV